MRGHSAVVCKFTPQMSQHTFGGSFLGADALGVCLCLLFARPVARSAFIDTLHAAASTEQQVAASASWTILGTVHSGCQSLCLPHTKSSAATKILCSVECFFSVGVDVFCLYFCGTFPFKGCLPGSWGKYRATHWILPLCPVVKRHSKSAKPWGTKGRTHSSLLLRSQCGSAGASGTSQAGSGTSTSGLLQAS